MQDRNRPSLLSRLILVVRGAWIADKLDGLVAQRQYQNALELLERELQRHSYPPSWKVRELQLHHLLGHDTWVVDRAKSLLLEIAEDHFLNEHDRKFLQCYVSQTTQYSSASLFGNAIRASYAFPFDAGALDLSRVSPMLKDMFPMTLDNQVSSQAQSSDS